MFFRITRSIAAKLKLAFVGMLGALFAFVIVFAGYAIDDLIGQLPENQPPKQFFFESSTYTLSQGGRSCLLPHPVDIAGDSRTDVSNWERSLENDQITYDGDLAIRVFPGKDQYAFVPDESGYRTQGGYTMYPDWLTGTHIRLACLPEAPLSWSSDPVSDCPVTIEQIAQLTNTDPSQWAMSVFDDNNVPNEGLGFYSSKQLSNYPLTEVKIDEVPQGVFVSRRAVGSLGYHPFGSTDSPLTPGYQDYEGEIGYIEVFCGNGSTRSQQSSV